MTKPNRLMRFVNKVHSYSPWIPDSWRRSILSFAFNSHIKYAGTTGIAIERWTAEETIVSLRNRSKIQNHIKGVHACAMATLAESATGMLFGLHVPDETHIPLLKSIRIQYKKIARGDLRAVATLSPEQRHQIQTQERGSIEVPVVVTDEEGKEPIDCELVWAWTVKKKKAATTNKESDDNNVNDTAGGGGGTSEPKQEGAVATNAK